MTLPPCCTSGRESCRRIPARPLPRGFLCNVRRLAGRCRLADGSARTEPQAADRLLRVAKKPDDDREWKGPRLPVFKPDPGKSADQSSEGVEASETIPAGEKLKPRDVLILKLLAEDLPPESVAEKLNPPTTGRAVIQTMFRVRKVLQCSTTAGACYKAMRQGLIS